ncbi:true [Symbiodinium natans]|uniref:True protein n=1 Tax=Symbiodinium natans TaxID=878477 RepID=A0A812NSN4_9DINO|nr:true [Symbiodinium natans]
MKSMLGEAGMSGFIKEPTLFRSDKVEEEKVASTAEGRKELVEAWSRRVVVQVSEPMRNVGDELEFLKRKCIKTDEGVAMLSGAKHLDGLIEAVGSVPRDTPADQSFSEIDKSPSLSPSKAKISRECVGRLLYLSHTRSDIQFAVCVLASKMSCPSVMSYKWLQRVVGYLVRTPNIGFLIRSPKAHACLGFPGDGSLEEGGKLVLESVTDDWAGCKASRRSKSSVHLYCAGGLLASYVRSQRSIAPSSSESEYIAMVSGATELVYLKEYLVYLSRGQS